MNASDNQRSIRAVIFFGIGYAVVGVTFPALANLSTFGEVQDMPRWAAWLVSVVAFVVHIAYEKFRQRSSPRSTALHASLAAAVGAFGLAVAANVHELWATPSYRPSLALALVLWPIMTAVPAFVVALAAAAGLARMRPKS